MDLFRQICGKIQFFHVHWKILCTGVGVKIWSLKQTAVAAVLKISNYAIECEMCTKWNDG